MGGRKHPERRPQASVPDPPPLSQLLRTIWVQPGPQNCSHSQKLDVVSTALPNPQWAARTHLPACAPGTPIRVTTGMIFGSNKYFRWTPRCQELCYVSPKTSVHVLK